MCAWGGVGSWGGVVGGGGSGGGAEGGVRSKIKYCFLGGGGGRELGWGNVKVSELPIPLIASAASEAILEEEEEEEKRVFIGSEPVL
jgi:hypothetical protein